VSRPLPDAEAQPEDGAGLFEEEEIPRAGPVGHLVAGIVPVLLGLFCLVYSISLSVGTPVNPGPGLWPATASVLLIVAGLWSLVFERHRRDGEAFTRGGLGIGIGIVTLIVYVFAMRRVGFEIPTLLVLAFWLRFLGKESWLMTAIVSACTTAVFYLLFIVLLGAPIPRLTFY
jgi:putative tricarboxylic transport membrane protein